MSRKRSMASKEIPPALTKDLVGVMGNMVIAQGLTNALRHGYRIELIPPPRLMVHLEVRFSDGQSKRIATYPVEMMEPGHPFPISRIPWQGPMDIMLSFEEHKPRSAPEKTE